MEKKQDFGFTSKARKVREFDFSKEIVVKRLISDPDALRERFTLIKLKHQDWSPDQVVKELQEYVVMQNVYSVALKEILYPAFEFDITEEDIKKIDVFKNQKSDLPEAARKNIIKSTIAIQLITASLAKMWNIKVSQEEAAAAVADRKLVDQKGLFNKFDDQYLEFLTGMDIAREKIARKVASLCKYKVDWDYIKAQAEKKKNQKK